MNSGVKSSSFHVLFQKRSITSWSEFAWPILDALSCTTTAMAQLHAQQFITGRRLEGSAPVTRETLAKITLRSYNAQELRSTLAASGLGESVCATLAVVAGNSEEEIMGGFWRLSGPVWTTGHKAESIFGPEIVGSGIVSVVFNVHGSDLTFSGDASPRNISKWMDGKASGLVSLRGADDQNLSPENWDQVGLSFRAMIIPLREHQALCYLSFVPISLEKLRNQCANHNTDLESVQVPSINLPIGDAVAQ